MISRLFHRPWVALLLAPLLLGGCGNSANDELVIVTTTTQITDMVKAVAGDRVEVVALMGPGVDPHTYKPSAQDIAKVGRADLILYNGLLLEGRMEDAFAQAERKGIKAYPVTQAIPEDQLLQPPGFSGHPDPHVWFDPALWTLCIDVVRDGLTEIDPAGKEVFAENAAKLKQEYLAVTNWAKSRISDIPEESRKLVTSHDAFNYFGRAFGLEVMAVQGMSTAVKASSSDRVKMVGYVKEYNLKAIFVESSVNPEMINGVARETGVQVGGKLFSDAMGKPGELETGSDGETYDVGTWVGMMKHNVNVIVEGLK
ncbi:MAG: ABC transporter substrate-binding protein [Opitutae bacterium]|nr:ABC transporter substrate-binding protein [Opitutae bacterium]|tara:strand:+ start:1337 stop:2275 length:939 start_codon:yes stop_codon:yes gene_type:complete